MVFLLPGEGFNPVLTVPIEVTAEVFPTLVLRKSSETVKIQLIDCRHLGCWLAQTLQPSAFSLVYPIDFDNHGLDAYSVTVSVTGRGETTHSPLSSVLKLPSQVTVKPSPVYTFGIATQAGPSSGSEVATPLPDRYSGIVQLDLPGNQTPVTIPIEVDVRSGLCWPVVVLINGLLLGRLLKYMKDKGGPQSDLLQRFYQLEARISGEPVDLQLLQPMLIAVKGRIYGMDLDGAKTDLAAIENRWNLLSRLRQLEQTLGNYNGNEGVPPILQSIQATRNLIAQGQDAAASAQVQQIDNAVRNLVAPPAVQVARAYKLAASLSGNARAAAAASAAGTISTPWYVSTFGWLTGVSEQFRAESTLWVIRPILYVLLVIALVIVGISQLYLKNPVFGADPLGDYFGIAVWAMSSDVASRSLTSLKVGS